MLKLIKCEFLKLKRKKFIPLIILSAFMFPIPLTYLMTTPSMMERYTDKADAFDGLFNMVLGYGIQFLPVSYTHLDVYKRQVQRNPSNRAASISRNCSQRQKQRAVT